MHQTKKNQNYSLYVYGIYTGCLNTEKHYAVLQAKFKTTAAYWLLVVFAALGLVFSTQETEIPLNRLIFACIICLIGIIGNQMFWYEDMVVQERFQSINLFEAMKLEYQNRWLPQLHQTKIFSHK